MPVTITVTAQTQQAAAAIEQFASSAGASFNRLQAAGNIAATSTATFTKNMTASRAMMIAFGRTASSLGFSIMPQVASQLALGASALQNISQAAKAADLSFVALAGRMGLIGAAAAAGYGLGRLLSSHTGLDERVQDFYRSLGFGMGADEQKASLATVEQNTAIYQSLLKVIAARRESGQLTEEEAAAMKRQADAASELTSASEAYESLKSVSAKLAPQHLDVKKFLAEYDLQLRQIDLAGETNAAGDPGARVAAVAKQIRLLGEQGREAHAALKRGSVEQAEFDQMEIDRLEKINALVSGKRDLQTQLIEQNFRLTDAEKFRTARDAGLNPQGPAPDSFSQQFAATFTQLQNQWGTWAQQAASSFASVFNSAVGSISNGITGLIMQTKTWGQALYQIGNTIMTSIVQSIVEMGVRWLMTHVIMRGAMAATHAAGVALGWSQVAATNAQEAAKTPALATTAALASVSSYGGAAVAGLAALIIALGVGIAAATGAFYTGGFTGHGDAREVAGVVHKEEVVFERSAVGRIGLQKLEALRRGEISLDDVNVPFRRVEVGGNAGGWASGGYTGSASGSGDYAAGENEYAAYYKQPSWWDWTAFFLASNIPGLMEATGNTMPEAKKIQPKNDGLSGALDMTSFTRTTAPAAQHGPSGIASAGEDGGSGRGGRGGRGGEKQLYITLNNLVDKKAWLEASRSDIEAIAVDTMRRNRHTFKV